MPVYVIYYCIKNIYNKNNIQNTIKIQLNITNKTKKIINCIDKSKAISYNEDRKKIVEKRRKYFGETERKVGINPKHSN